MSTFKLRNNTARTYGFANGLCIAGSGCKTPPEAHKADPNFSLPPLYELSEDQMFKSYRGILAAMAETTPQGKSAIEVFVEGVKQPLTAVEITGWVDEHRTGRGWKKPETRKEHAQEAERAMNRPEDPIEAFQRNAQDERDRRLVGLVVEALKAQAALPPPPAKK